MAADEQQRAEALRLLKGAPPEAATPGALAHRLGISPDEAERLVGRLEDDGSVRREGERLVVVEPAASQAEGDRPVP